VGNSGPGSIKEGPAVHLSARLTGMVEGPAVDLVGTPGDPIVALSADTRLAASALLDASGIRSAEIL
jgi:hypothetical protein